MKSAVHLQKKIKKAMRNVATRGWPEAKDPDAPKRPAGGAYGVWMSENRQRILASLPKGSRVTEASKKGSKEWNAMSEEAKKPFQAGSQGLDLGLGSFFRVHRWVVWGLAMWRWTIYR